MRRGCLSRRALPDLGPAPGLWLATPQRVSGAVFSSSSARHAESGRPHECHGPAAVHRRRRRCLVGSGGNRRHQRHRHRQRRAVHLSHADDACAGHAIGGGADQCHGTADRDRRSGLGTGVGDAGQRAKRHGRRGSEGRSAGTSATPTPRIAGLCAEAAPTPALVRAPIPRHLVLHGDFRRRGRNCRRSGKPRGTHRLQHPCQHDQFDPVARTGDSADPLRICTLSCRPTAYGTR